VTTAANHEASLLRDAAFLRRQGALDSDEWVITPDGYYISMPRMITVARPRLSLEMCAIAASVFALVVSAIWMAAPAEFVWFVVIAVYSLRARLFRSGLDHVLDEACATPRRERYLSEVMQ
jgi:hypothetical protein